MDDSIAIVGAGLCGNLLAIMLAQRGLNVTVYEREPLDSTQSASRSINLALAARGIAALKAADVYADIEPLLLPMRGRIVHQRDGSTRFLRYGQRDNECIWSVSRQALNRKLCQLAQSRYGAHYVFAHECVDFDPRSVSAKLRTDGHEIEIQPQLLIGADGAGSVIRRSLTAAGIIATQQDLLDHGYKELTLPAGADGNFQLDPEGLHIWPRGGFMLIALPNLDRTFTATLFLPNSGTNSFAEVTAANVGEFFAQEFPDALELMPQLLLDFAHNPVGELGTIRCQPWRHTPSPAHNTLLIGDAAHAIVPFHGQGMNAAFEDCAELGRLTDQHQTDWITITQEFESLRRANANAIADMALENYAEMRDTVRRPEFEQRALLAFELERHFAGRFVPRYSMVMFHPEIPYAEAQRRGRIQAQILDALAGETDPKQRLQRAATMIDERLPAI